MRPLSHALWLLAGAVTGAVLAGVFSPLLDAGLNDGAATAAVVPALINCGAAGSLAARCIAR